MNTYGLFLAIALISGIVAFYFLSRKFKLSSSNLIENIFYIFALSILGARITYIILYSNQFSSSADYFKIWQGGLVSFGGIIVGIFTALFVFQKKNRGLYFDVLAISFFVGWFFGRIGGFLTQNAIGVESDFFGNFFYNRVPIQLSESFISFLIVIVGIIMLNYLFKKKINYRGYLIFVLSLAIYCFGRFTIDFWREQNIVAFGLGLGQFVSIILFICCIIILCRPNHFFQLILSENKT